MSPLWLAAPLAVVAVVGMTLAALRIAAERRRRATAEHALEALSSITDPALARLAPDEVFRELLARTVRVLGADLASLLVLDEQGRLVVRASTGLDALVEGPVVMEVGQGLTGEVAATGSPLLVADVRAEDVGVEALRDHLRSYLGCPLLVEGEVSGVLAVGAKRPSAFSTDDLRLANRVAERFAWSVERDQFEQSERAARLAIEENEHRLRTMLEAAPLGVVECDIDGEIVRWNRGAADLLEWPRWLPGAEVPGELPVEAREAIRLAATGHRTEGIAATVSRTGSRDAEVRISASPITDPGGNVEGVLALIDDVTEHQQLEQHIRQAQRLEAMARLAGGIAHDFNNLLTVVRGPSEVLLKTLDPDDDRREDAEAIRVASHRAAELTKQLLTIGRRQQVEPHVLDLHERARELAPVLRRLVGDDVDLRAVISPSAGHVRVDPGDLDQTIMNLVINARDAMPSGGRIMVETRNIEMRPRGASLAGVTAGRYVLVTVADTGSGMPRNVVEHCFDPFFSTKGRGKGTGLGLALVYSTATRAGGHATVESEVGRGTTFRVWFPEVDPANEQPVPAATRRRRRSGRIATKPCRILLVDDEAPVRSLARAALEDAGHELMEAASAEEAMQKAESERQAFDLLVSDIVLGGVRGDELAVMMRKKWKRLRVVLMSGYTDQPMILEPDGFLAKPFALDDLTALVADVMGIDPPDAPLPAAAKKPPAKKAPAKKRAQGSKR